MENGSIVVAGGDVSLICPPEMTDCTYWEHLGYRAKSFLIRVSEAGQVDESIAVAASNFHLLAIAQQTDGKIVAAGRKLSRTSHDSKFVVYRLNQDGSVDSGFGTNGEVQLPATETGRDDQATAVIIEPDGRIVVAGSRTLSDVKVEILIRLLANGEFDQTFGSSGIIVLPGGTGNPFPAQAYPNWRTQVLRTTAGAYRVPVTDGCQIVGLTSGGAFDLAFGSSGTVRIDHPISSSCQLSVATQADGRLVIGASDGEAAVVTRLLADGQSDPSFLRGTDFQDSVGGGRITSLAVAPDGAIVVVQGLGDFEYEGVIRRLLPGGELDTSFGNAGSTVIDMPSEVGALNILFYMFVREDGRVVAVGGDPYASRSHGPIIVRLLGTDAGDSAGVLGVASSFVSTSENEDDAVVHVRRTGGNTGSVSVAYLTEELDYNAATGGDDFGEVSGFLSWDDGDMTTKQIHVPVYDDMIGEGPEYFRVRLDDAQGGAGLGTRNAEVEIRNDGDPMNELTIGPANSIGAIEGQSAEINITLDRRNPGEITVQLLPIGGAATAGDDFDASRMTVTWPDGGEGTKSVSIAINDDPDAEETESFNVRLSIIAGSAQFASGSVESEILVSIAPNDQPPSSPPPSADGGGGAAALDLVLLLGLVLGSYVPRTTSPRSSTIRAWRCLALTSDF